MQCCGENIADGIPLGPGATQYSTLSNQLHYGNHILHDDNMHIHEHAGSHIQTDTK